MLKIAMLSYHTCPLATLGGKDTGGMNVYVRELARTLGNLDVRVDVFTRSQDEHAPHIMHTLGSNSRVIHIPAGPETPRPKSELPTYLPEFSNRIREFADQEGISYDIVHSHYWMSGLSGLELRAAWQTPLIHMFHTLGHMKNRIAASPSEMETAARLQGEQELVDRANLLIAATMAEESQLEFLYQAEPRKIRVIPPGVDLQRFKPFASEIAKAQLGIPAGENMLLFVGRIEPLKGIETLIHAIASMHHSGVLQQYPHYLAIIGGDPVLSEMQQSSEMSRLQTLCRELNLGDLVVFLGKRSQDSLPLYYSAATALVMPSHYESFGMVALEAMACGTPVVASQVGGLAFLVQNGQTGFVVPDGDVRALGEKLTRLITDPQLRSRLGRQAAEYALAYSWENIASQIMEVYQDVLSTS